MCAADSNDQDEQDSAHPAGGCEKIGNQIDDAVRTAFYKVGKFVAFRPKLTIVLSIVFALVCGGGFARFTTESRPEKLWVPQGTTAANEEDQYLALYPPTGRFNTMIVTAVATSSSNNNNVLTKERLMEAMQVHEEIASTVVVVAANGRKNITLTDICTQAGGTCASSVTAECRCLMNGILGLWNYDLVTLQNDTDILATLNNGRSKQDLEAVLGNPIFDDNDDGNLVSAEAFVQSYFNNDQVDTTEGTTDDPVSEAWELEAFLNNLEDVNNNANARIRVEYFAGRSFSDEFGEAISGDISLVQASYVVTFLFLGATLGHWKCGPGSRWSMSIAALVMIALSTLAGFGISSAIGLFYGPVHSLLPFVLLGVSTLYCTTLFVTDLLYLLWLFFSSS